MDSGNYDFVDLTDTENCGSPTSDSETPGENNSRLFTKNNSEMVRLFHKNASDDKIKEVYH